jgi:hypothetical protein
MTGSHHLTLLDRQSIQAAIEEGKTKAEIARTLGKNPSGISREIMKHRELKERNKYGRQILCAKRNTCKSRCQYGCKDFTDPSCIRRDRLPGACNGCEKRAKCNMDKYYYHAARADARYREELVACQEGINIDESERNSIAVQGRQLFLKRAGKQEAIQGKVQETKGTGQLRWASVHGLRRVHQT